MFELVGKLYLYIWLIGFVVGGLFVVCLGYLMIVRIMCKNI